MVLLARAACAPGAPTTPAPTPIFPPTATSSPTPETAPPSTPSAGAARRTPITTLGEQGWVDHSDYRNGLIAVEQALLAKGLAHASVYHIEM